MSENSNTGLAGDFSDDESKTVEIYLPAEKVNEILCLLEVPMPDANDLDKLLIYVKHELGFAASLRERENNS